MPKKPAPPLKKPTNRKSNAGRPTVYRKEMAEQARKLYARGATDVQVADFFNVSVVTLWRWAHTNEEFCKAQIQGCEDADERVERSLFAKATGYTYDAEKIFCDAKNGVTRVKYREHVPPSDTAAIFWLKNRRRERWRDKQEIEHGGTESIVKLLEEIAAERALQRSAPIIEAKAIERKDEEEE